MNIRRGGSGDIFESTYVRVGAKERVNENLDSFLNGERFARNRATI